MRKRIYLDYAATTPIDPSILKAMLPYLKKEYGNPSSQHAAGQKAKAAVENARVLVASFLVCQAQEVVFTSSASEANNLAIYGVVRGKQKPHIIASEIEHESVLSPIQELEKRGVLDVTYVSVNKEGVVNSEDVVRAIKENTVLVSVMYANSEIGTVQPIAEIGKLIKKCNKERGKQKMLFHTDAVQAAQYLSCDVGRLGVDLLTLSSHKIYGAKGTGLLYIKEGTELSPLVFGGGQEGGMRSGTENVAGIVAMGTAIKDIKSPKTNVQNIKIRQMRDKLLKNILKRIPEIELTGSKEQRLVNNIHLRFKGIEGRDLVLALDQKGLAVSTGSACSERSQEPSHVLLAMGFSAKEAMSSLRITLGKYTTQEEIEYTVKILSNTVEQLRKYKV